jgi:hypothetical protein
MKRGAALINAAVGADNATAATGKRSRLGNGASVGNDTIATDGIILMAAGALGLVLSLLFWSSFSPYRRGGTVVGGDTVVEERHIHRDLP